ncbi:MAG: cysteine hydrolase family protein [Plesiomonas sp.]|uniref:cysteine hydrolase family protein n=1 Tax=Plesiomonas sp. TaxID=2486279 RepID=UPI003F2E2AEE
MSVSCCQDNHHATPKIALLLLDFMNETIDPQGKSAARGYAEFAHQHHSLQHIATLLHHARAQQWKVIHVRVAFSADYREVNTNSPLFAGAAKAGAFQDGSWGGEFYPAFAPQAGEDVITKHRVSAWYGTDLALRLRAAGITQLVMAGCATDLVVQSTVREAHDQDFICTVVSDCCIAACDDDQNATLRMLEKVAHVLTVDAITGC